MVDVEDMSKRSLIQHMKKRFDMNFDEDLDLELFDVTDGNVKYDRDTLVGLFCEANIESDLRDENDIELCYLHPKSLPAGYKFEIKQGCVGLCLAMVKEE